MARLANSPESLKEGSKGYVKSEHLALSLEGPVKLGDYYGQLFRGWFVPPATTRYRFYMACDDFCKL